MTEIEIIENIRQEQVFDFRELKDILVSKINSAENLNNTNIIRFELPVQKINILHWLDQQTFDLKIYWSERSGDLEIGGVGQADIVTGDHISNIRDTIKYINNHLSKDYKFQRYYGGFQFQKDENPDELWQHFGKLYFYLPLFEILNVNGVYYFCCNLCLKVSANRADQIKQVLKEIDNLHFGNHIGYSNHIELFSRKNLPDKNEWEKTINSALRIIENHTLEKVVLARKVILKFNEDLNAYSLLTKLKSFNPYSTQFSFQLKKNLAFLGSSPELLYHRKNNKIYSEAIAGTRRRGKDEQEDRIFEKELLESDKERREHAFVVESIKESLNKICTKVTANKEISVLKLNQIQHLYSNFFGDLKNNVSDAEILELLHPTPAVGGFPANEALLQIKSLEPFKRGWYAGPVGWLGYNSAEFAVAIRSGLITGKILTLYSGGGIVKGSNDKSEWLEAENKISNFLKAFGINGESSY